MSTGYAYELPAGKPDDALADALADVEAGRISYLTRHGQPVAALVPVDELVELQHALDLVDLAEVETIKARGGPQIPHDVVEAMMAADDATHDAMAATLDARDSEHVSPDEVRAIWEMITTRDGT
jgi:antitoxin (DNA-binding transcriptional repressor) of toxin-antitoxin stability system